MLFRSPRTAYNAYTTLAGFQFFLLMFIVPAMTAGAISSEREKQTLDLLLCTNLSPLSIVFGKMTVSIAQIMLLITASLPVMSMVFMFGGIKPADLLLLFAFYLTTAIMLGSIGIFCSTVFKKSSVANIMSYLILLFLLFGTTVMFGIWQRLTMDPMQYQPPTLGTVMLFMSANPLFGFGYLLEGSHGAMSLMGMVFSIGRSINPGATPPIIKPWMANIIFNVTTAIILIPLSAWRLKTARKPLFRKEIGRASCRVRV